jgi:hypothetical protein
MLKSDVTVYSTDDKYSISYFGDDNIETIRNRIGAAMNTHPDRLFILVSIELKNNYYEKDPRRLEALFDRLSYSGKTILKDAFSDYQSIYRSPQTNIGYQEIDKTEWLGKPTYLEEIHSATRDFREYRIFGVKEEKSYILPLNLYSANIVKTIPSSQLPNPELNLLLSTLYNPETIKEFFVIPYNEDYDPIAYVYFPRLTSNTPNQLNVEAIKLIEKNTKLLNDLLQLDIPKEKSANITRAKYYTKFVETDFGDALRSRFEQIFFGLTVSEDIPYVGLFNSTSEVIRHKFYAESVKGKKTPYLDLAIWKVWMSRKLSRNIPTLILLRGKDKENYDRVTITETDITMILYRDERNLESIEKMKSDCLKWIKTLDSVMAFVNRNDVDTERWLLQDIEMNVNYSNEIENIDLRRMHCISFLFNQTSPDSVEFNFLRTDKSSFNIDPIEIKIIQLINDGELDANALSEELGIPLERTQVKIREVQNKLEEDPNLGDREFRRQPSLAVYEDYIKVSFVTDIDRIIQYSNILRYTVGTAGLKLDKICPKRTETITTEVSNVKTQEAPVSNAFSSFFDFSELEEEEEQKVEQTVKSTKEKNTTVPIPSSLKSAYSYYKSRLDQFDEQTFNPTGVKDFKYTKWCSKEFQPIVMSKKELEKLEDTDYDPRVNITEEDKKLDLYDPDGLAICPEYWCIQDLIPLTQEQLIEVDEEGNLGCPACLRRLITDVDKQISNKNFSVLKRKDAEYVYPDFISGKSGVNGKELPCCFKTSRFKSKKADQSNKDYIVDEKTPRLKELRVAFLPQNLINSLYIDEDYQFVKTTTGRRLQNGTSGFFRLGIGRPSENIPKILDLNTKVSSPKDSIETVMKCSFLRTWKTLSDKDSNEIKQSLNKLPQYAGNTLVIENLTKIISGINEAFEKNKLSVIEELEYTCLFLSCDVFRVHIDTNTLGCMFYSPMTRPRNRGIIILQNKNIVDVLAYVVRFPKGYEYKANIFKSPFKKETYLEVEKLRNNACKTKLPSLDTALNIVKDVLTETGEQDFQIILDPFGRGQSLFVPNHMFIPFQPVPLPNMTQPKILGYHTVNNETLPKYNRVKQYLEKASTYDDGYKLVEDLIDDENNRVEILLKSGLRIPVSPEKTEQKEPLEIIETVNKLGEDKLVFGEESKLLDNSYKKTSYSSEVFEFLIYELTKDLAAYDYVALRRTLLEPNPKIKEVEPQLRKWFNAKIEFVNIKSPFEFISKIRKPCGQFKSKEKCTGNLCSWNGKTCKIEIRDVIRKEPLFNKLLSTLVENSKIKAMVLDGLTTPFFSTALYLELPNELILSDLDLVNISVV